jgi:hypothetical protein
MALPAPALPQPSYPQTQDTVAAALCAAELNEPFDLVHAPQVALAELFANVQQLSALVPFATFRLLARLSCDDRDEVRVGVTRALGSFVGMYPDRVEELLLPLSCDPARRVRNAAVDTLSMLLRVLPDPENLVERWRWHPDRAVDVLEKAKKLNQKR